MVWGMAGFLSLSIPVLVLKKFLKLKSVFSLLLLVLHEVYL